MRDADSACAFSHAARALSSSACVHTVTATLQHVVHSGHLLPTVQIEHVVKCHMFRPAQCAGLQNAQLHTVPRP